MKQEDKKRFTSRKWIMGMTSLIAGIVFAILDANDIIAIPWYITILLLMIALTWLITEGYLDKRSVEYLERIGVLKKK